MEVEAALGGVFVRLAAGRQPERQREAENAPAPQHQMQPVIGEYGGEAEGEGAEALDDQVSGPPAAGRRAPGGG